MEESRMVINENDLWSHATSAEKDIARLSRMAELEYIKELFEKYLPVGTDTKEIDDYLTMCEQELENGNELTNEDFPERGEIIDPETGKPVVIKYYSASRLKQRAALPLRRDIGSSNQSEHYKITNGQDLEHTEAPGSDSSVQDEHPES